MDTKDALKLAKEYKGAIKDLVGNAKIYMYGSYSRGEQRSTSDIDIAIVIPRYEGNDWLKFCGLLWHRTINISTLIEPVLIEECNPSPLYDDVMRTGIAI